MKIGNKIKELRLKNDLTLSELASRSEVTKGFLSQLERDLTSPNVSTLEDILEALGTNLSEFFQERPQEQIVFGQDDYFVDEREHEKIEWIVPNAQKNDMEPVLLTLHGYSQTRIIESFDGQEFGYVLKGRVQLVVGNRSFRVKKGETFYMSASQSHYLYNPNGYEAKLLWITTPPMF